MKNQPEKGPQTEERYVVYLTEGKWSVAAGTYKTERRAEQRLLKLRRKYGPLGYAVQIRLIEELVCDHTTGHPSETAIRPVE